MESAHFTRALLALLDETFDHVHGFYLDKNTSLFETLADITAAEASIPVGGGCATLAAQVSHTAFYLDVVEREVRNPASPRADWGEIWRTVNAVSPEEWDAIRTNLRQSYLRIQKLIEEAPLWSDADQIGGAMALVAHTAYHLGEIRQALCILRSSHD